MEFRETLLAAQRNQQQQQSSAKSFYKAKFEPPKKEQKQKDKLSANIQKFLAKKDEEEKQKKVEIQKKRDDLFAMRDQKAINKIQKTLKVIKSANKSVLLDAIDREHTAVTREGPDQPDQDDYGYESQEAAAIYEKMMQKYSKIPDEPKFPTGNKGTKRDLNGTRERVKNALQHEEEPVPHRRRRKADRDKESSPVNEPEREKKKDEQPKADKPKIRRPFPPPLDFNQLLKLAEQKKSEPLDVASKKAVVEQDTERPMTKKQKREYEEEMARRQRRQERLDADKGGKMVAAVKEEKSSEREKKPETMRIPKLGDNSRHNSPKLSERDRQVNDKDKLQRERDRARLEKERLERNREKLDKDKAEREKGKLDKERLDKLKAERERIDRDIERLNRDRERLEKTKSQLETTVQSDRNNKSVDRSKLLPKEQARRPDFQKNIDLKSQNTYRIDKNSNEKKIVPSKTSNGKYPTGESINSKPIPKIGKDNLQPKNGIKNKEILAKQRPVNGSLKDTKIENKGSLESRPLKKADERNVQNKPGAGPSKPKSTSFDFDKHINSIGKDSSRKFPPGDVRRKQQAEDVRRKAKRRLDSDSEYDSEMDDFIDDGDENMDYSRHIKEIFGYDKSKYRYMDDEDDPTMESSFARQQREEYISKKMGIMEDLEDMKMEAMQKKNSKKKRRISDD